MPLRIHHFPPSHLDIASTAAARVPVRLTPPSSCLLFRFFLRTQWSPNPSRTTLPPARTPALSATLLFLRISVEQRRGIIPFSCASTILLSIYFPPFFLPWLALSRRSQQPWIASRSHPPHPPTLTAPSVSPVLSLLAFSRSRSLLALAFASSTANLLRHL